MSKEDKGRSRKGRHPFILWPCYTKGRTSRSHGKALSQWKLGLCSVSYLPMLGALLRSHSDIVPHLKANQTDLCPSVITIVSTTLGSVRFSKATSTDKPPLSKTEYLLRLCSAPRASLQHLCNQNRAFLCITVNQTQSGQS